jgi:hypothetical protein
VCVSSISRLIQLTSTSLIDVYRTNSNRQCNVEGNWGLHKTWSWLRGDKRPPTPALCTVIDGRLLFRASTIYINSLLITYIVNPFIADLSHKILYIGAPWPHGLQKRHNPFIAALKSHETTLHWYGGHPWAGSASELKKSYPPWAGEALNGLI